MEVCCGFVPRRKEREKVHAPNVYSVNNNVINKSSQHDTVPGRTEISVKGSQATTSHSMQEYGAIDPGDRVVQKLDFM